MLLTPPPERPGSPEDVRQSGDDAKVEVKEEAKAQGFANQAPPPPPEPKEPPPNTNKGPTGRIAPALYGLDSVPRDSKNRRGHVVPMSTATHPRDRWETLFVYAFITKFTKLHETVPGFYSCDDFENGLLAQPGEPDLVLEHVVRVFIKNLRPQTRNLSPSLLPQTIETILLEFPATAQGERGVFWDQVTQRHKNPLKEVEGGFWYANWDVKLRILRQLVDWQLTHSFIIRDIIDTAWGTKKKAHKKEALAPRPPPPPEDPQSKESLAFHPIGQDQTRTRFWVADSSPRMWTSTNPWKVTSLFDSVAETRADYLAAIDTLRASAPPEIEFTSETEVFGKRPHRDISHWQLIFALELRVDAIDQEFKRVEEARQTQGQEIVDIQHATELEEVDELLTPVTRSKGTMAIDEEEPVTEEEPVKDEGSHASKSQEPDTELDAPDDDDEEVDQLADDDDDDYKQDQDLKHLLAVVPPMKTTKAARERKVVDEGESDDYGSRRRSGRGVKRRRPSVPHASNEADLRRSGRAKRQKTDDAANTSAFLHEDSSSEEVIQEKRGAPLPPPTISEAGSTTIVSEQLAATSLDVPPPRQQEPTIPAPDDGRPNTPTVAPDTKKVKGGRKSNARFWVYAEIDEDALPKDLPDPDALMRKPRRSRGGEKQAKKQDEAEVNGRAPPETNGLSKPAARRGRWRGGRGGKQKPAETDDDETSVAAPVSRLETP